MGTRNSTIVTLNGEIRVAQYGQWDGYPTGQGKTIQEFLKTADLEDFKKKVAALRDITEEDEKKVNETENWTKVYPHLSRDAGAGVLEMIAAGTVEFLVLDKEFKNDGLFCEYWYDINLDKETVTMNGIEFTFDEWRNMDLEKLENEGRED